MISNKTDLELALIANIDIPIPELQLVLHQPILKDIAHIGETSFFQAINYLCLDKDNLIEDKKISENLNNFQVLLKVIEQPDCKNIRETIMTLLSLLFLNKKVVIMPKSIILTNTETKENILIDETNFNILQDILKEVFCIHSIFQGDNIVYNPANKAAQKIADKIMKNRKKVAALKEKQNKGSIISRYISILTVSLNKTYKECSEMNLFQLFDLMKRVELKEAWDIDLKVRLAGGNPNNEAEDWRKELYN